MANNEQRGDGAMAAGEKALKAFSIFGKKYDEAIEHFTKAANLFKMAKEWKKAGDAFKRIADIHAAIKNSGYEVANALTEASKCYQKTDAQEAIKSLLLAIQIFLEEGKFSIAARHEKTIAEMYENEGDIQNAMEHYEKAGDLNDSENAVAAGNQCKLKVAHYAAQLEQYAKAIEIFEKVASASLENNLLKWSAKEYFMKAGICHLCLDDIVSAKRAIQKYKDLDINFSTQRECVFLEKMIEAYEKYDVDAFTNAIREFDNITKLDSWKTNLLLRVKNNINKEEDLL